MTATAEELVARLRRYPDDRAAYAALKAHYHQQNDFASLANLVEGWARRTEDAELAARAFHEAALLVEHYQSDHVRAVELFELALERDPYLNDAHRDLEHLIEAVGDPRLRIESLERRIELLTKASVEPARIALLRYKLGEAWERGYHRADRALGQYLAALSLEPNMVPALYAARVAYQEAGNFVEAANFLEREASIEPDRDRALSLYRELGQLRAQQLDDVDGAVRAAEAALSLSPGSFDVLHDLAYLLHGRASRNAGTPAGVADAERAAAVYFQLAQSSRDGDALALCEATLDLVPVHEAALDLLEFVAHDLGRTDILPLRWVGYLREAPDSPAARRRRHALATAYVEVDQIEDAIYCLEPLLSVRDPRAAETLSELYLRQGRTEDAHAALAVAVEALPADQRAARIHAAIEALESAGRRDEAVRRAEELFEADPADEFARAFLENVYVEAGDTARRVALRASAARAEIVPFETRAALYREAAELAGAANDSEGAYEAWRALLELEPGAEDALAHLRSHLEAGSRWDELAAILERSALTLTDPMEKSALLLELATLHLERRRDPAEAVRVLRAARELSPGDRDVRDRLCDLLVEAGPGEEAIPLLHERLAEAPDKEQRIRFQHALADALEVGLGDLDGAYLVSQRIVEADARDVRALERMERIDLALGHPHRLLDTLGRRAAVVTHEERASLLVRMAEVADGSLGEADRAASLYRQALSLSPLDVAAREGLRELLGRVEKYDELATLLDELVASEIDVERRRAYLRELARVLGGPLDDKDRAAEAYGALLEDIDDPEAVAALLDHAERRGDLARWARLADSRIAHLGDTGAAQELRLARAEVLVRELGELHEAARVLEEALTHVPGHVGALSQLEDVYERLGNHASLAETLEAHVAILEDGAAKAPLAARLSLLYAQPLGRPDDAIRTARDWVRYAPDEEEPLRHLASLLEDHGPPEQLLEALDALVQLDPPRGREHVVRSAQVCAGPMGDPGAGFDRLAARLEEGDDGILPALRAYALEHERARPLAELVDRHAISAGDSPRAFGLHQAAAAIWLDHVGDPKAAMTSALRAFEARPGDLAALERLDGLAALADDFDRLVEAYRTVLVSGIPEDQQIDTIVRLASVLEGPARDPGRALEALGSACARRPLREDLFERAEGLARASGRFDLLLDIYERRVSAVQGDLKLEALLRCADIACGSLGELERSLAHVGRAATLVAASPRDLARIESLAARLDADLGKPAGEPVRSHLVGIYGSLAERPGIGRARTTLFLRAARMLAEALRRPRDAFELLRDAAAADPSEERLLRELHSVARGAGLLEEFASVLESLVDQAMDARTAARLSGRRGDLLRDELGRPSDAADAYRRMLTLTPSDARARKSLRHALQAAGRFEDLVMNLEKELRNTEALSKEERLVLRRVVAMTWEGPLHNRWEAIDAWKAFLRESPDDASALEALRRIEAGDPLDEAPPELERPEPEPVDDFEDEEVTAIGAAARDEDDVLSLETLAEVLVEDDEAVGDEDDLEESTIPGPPVPADLHAVRRSTAPPPPPPEATARRTTAPPPPGAVRAAEAASGLDTLMDVADFVDELDASASAERTLADEERIVPGEPVAKREPEPEPT